MYTVTSGTPGANSPSNHLTSGSRLGSGRSGRFLLGLIVASDQRLGQARPHNLVRVFPVYVRVHPAGAPKFRRPKAGLRQTRSVGRALFKFCQLVRAVQSLLLDLPSHAIAWQGRGTVAECFRLPTTAHGDHSPQRVVYKYHCERSLFGPRAIADRT
jgi:hypothetical protein